MSSSTTQAPATAVNDEPMVVWSISRTQKDFLNTRLPDYKAAFLAKTLNVFWLTFYKDWFKKWPVKDEQVCFVEEVSA